MAVVYYIKRPYENNGRQTIYRDAFNVIRDRLDIILF